MIMIGMIKGAIREMIPVMIENTIIITPIIPKISNNFFHHLSIPNTCTFGPPEDCLDELCLEGLIGMEVYYSTHTPEQTQYLLKLAEEYHLMPGGGSDFHGTNKPTISLGTGKRNLHIPYEILEGLRRRRAELSQ